MNTIIKKLDENNIDKSVIAKAAEIIRSGGLVAFPTETVYGLGGDALNKESSKKIYAAKGRPSDNPLIAHIASLDMLYEITKEVSPLAKKLIDKFWPGPMTLIFKKKSLIPDETTGGLDTVAVRFPENKIAMELIKASGVPIAAPSANISGSPSPTLGEHVIDDMDGRIDMIIDGGKVGMGLESTIIDVSGKDPVILRPGFITPKMIEDICGSVELDSVIFNKPEDGYVPKAPGMKYRHYAPKAELTIYRGDYRKVADKIKELAAKKTDEGVKCAIITTDQHQSLYKGHVDDSVLIITLGDETHPEMIAGNVFSALRSIDKTDAEYVFCEAFSQDDVGLATMNRLTKAAAYHVEDVR